MIDAMTCVLALQGIRVTRITTRSIQDLHSTSQEARKCSPSLHASARIAISLKLNKLYSGSVIRTTSAPDSPMSRRHPFSCNVTSAILSQRSLIYFL